MAVRRARRSPPAGRRRRQHKSRPSYFVTDCFACVWKRCHGCRLLLPLLLARLGKKGVREGE